MAPWSLILKRLRRQAFTAEELFDSVQSLIGDLSWARRSAPQFASNFDVKFADGESFHSVWKSESMRVGVVIHPSKAVNRLNFTWKL
jgi:hypothetical protein